VSEYHFELVETLLITYWLNCLG